MQISTFAGQFFDCGKVAQAGFKWMSQQCVENLMAHDRDDKGIAESARSDDGFTLVELMIVLVIVSILMAFAVPAMTGFLKNDRLVAQINTLAGFLSHARSEAVTRHQSVVLCASDNQTSCSSTNWADGWILFVDADNDGNVTTGDELLGQFQDISDGNTLLGSMGRRVTYDARGFAPASIGNFALCDDRGVEHLRSISIQRTGRVQRGGATLCTG